MKIFLDINVLVSGFATRGLCSDVIRLVLAEHELITGEVVLAELKQVLNRRFSCPPSRLKRFWFFSKTKQSSLSQNHFLSFKSEMKPISGCSRPH